MDWGVGMLNSIKMKLIVFVSVLMLIISASIMGAILYFFTNYTENSAKDQAQAGTAGMHKLLEDAKLEMKTNAVTLAANPNIAQAIAAKDTALVLQLLAPILKESPVDSITISDEQGIVIARTHEPAKKGDSVAIRPM